MKTEELKHNALSYMAESGYPIREAVLLEVDPTLPIMGYTTERNGKTLIVISEWSLATDMVMGLIIHELSHVYRTESGHPSHNFRLHTGVLQQLFGIEPPHYRLEVVRNAINNLQDLYADDISFAVYKKHLQLPDLNEFFLGWIRDPLPATSVRNRWQNSGLLLNAAFAQANLERHGIEDTNEKVKKAISDFLEKIDPNLAKQFAYFKNFMVQLPEDISDENFANLLMEYLHELIILAEK